jgi:polyisoprenoid-binding protein YceI
MATWIFEPGHTAAEFCVCHMMTTPVRGHFKNVQGTLAFDPDKQVLLSLEATMGAAEIWTGEKQRDEHLRSDDFLYAAHYPTITFRSIKAERTGASDYELTGNLTIRGVTRSVNLELRYVGRWRTPYNEEHVTRVGFTGGTRINRHDFGVSWHSQMENGGVVVGSEVVITVDVEAILETELRPLLEKQSVR